ncbi:STAS domain-containing protein [Streptomyces xanthochromogenes]|uniref:STAS domain-containing protein n=1 Tax=Streptomyces xanthochromogenes TaxID=67384 RepID=A0ABQ3AX52_9ACTN|nr:STAS domain-containing protein [Streptomyces xanthochromogenes]GGY69669.1 hypothetical protein GCM10010326_74920 [Streptomyces xanthochromogenes]
MADRQHHPGPVAAQYPHNGCHVIVARGELDLDTTPDLAAALAKAADEHDVVVIDLSAVTFADSAVLNLLSRPPHHHAAYRRAPSADPAPA